MYVPPHFQEPRTEALFDLMEKNPLGVLVTCGRSGLDANHLPFELERGQGAHGVLHCHVARANPVWQDITDGEEVLVIFRAAHAYISPNWYPSKHESHRQVPTWNYQVAHAYGRATIRDDRRYVGSLVARLTRTHEASQPVPWRMADSPADYLDTLLRAIVGIEIGITRLLGKVKLSQNKDVRDIEGAAAALQAQGDREIAAAMSAAAAGKVP